MKKKNVILVLIIFLTITSLIGVVLSCCLLIFNGKTPESIFKECKQCVLELKAETDNVGTSFGTAEIIDSDGSLVTNAHVVTYKSMGETKLFEKISVRFIDDEEFVEVQIEKYDTELDIAILKFVNSDKKFSHLTIGSSKKLKNGEKVYAIGNMSNFGLSITEGLVSMAKVNVSNNGVTREVIQCDLTISDGNSGGALINKNGELVGITTFRLKDNSSNVVYGISYCIPIDVVMEYIKN